MSATHVAELTAVLTGAAFGTTDNLPARATLVAIAADGSLRVQLKDGSECRCDWLETALSPTQALAVGDRGQRVVPENPAAAVVERKVRTRHVADEQVERVDAFQQPGPSREPRCLAGQRRHRELGDVRQQRGGQRAVLLFGS